MVVNISDFWLILDDYFEMKINKYERINWNFMFYAQFITVINIICLEWTEL